MLWFGLFLPRLPIEVFLRTVEQTRPAARRDASRLSSGQRLPGEMQFAVCDRLRVLQASESAQALGVHPGMKRATALALAPALEIVERDPVREHEALHQMACWALQFTPAVSLQPPTAPEDSDAVSGAGSPHGSRRRSPDGEPQRRGLLLEVEPSLGLFGGRDALIARLRVGLAQLGFCAQIGCAPTATGAWLLAGHRDGASAATVAQLDARLSGLPVARLDAATPHLATLESIGARTIRDLARLPRAGLARRFGGALLDELDRAFGRQPEPRSWFEAPPVFDARLELLADADSAEALFFAGRRLIAQLCGWLSARHAAAHAFEFAAEHDGRPPTLLEVRLADASRDGERIAGLLRETLAVTRLPAPVHTLRLHCERVSSLAAADGDLFPVPASAREGLGRLIERLQARLGRDRIQRLQLACDHRPEAAYRAEPVEGAAQPRPPSTPAVFAAGTLPRPLWLLGRPIPIAERNNRPYWNGPLALLAGPERIEAGWWDGALVQRDYFIASDESHALLWIYRERLPQADSRSGWFIQGRFG